MALPKLNTTPKYELTIPSTGETLKFRPFLVKEQKVLLVAYESQDQQQILSAILDCIQACVQDVSLNKLATFDSDYIFSRIRSKSVGEVTDVKATCSSCGHESDKKIDLNGLQVFGKIKKNIEIDLNEDIKVKMKYPTYTDFIKDPKIFSDAVSYTHLTLPTILPV